LKSALLCGLGNPGNRYAHTRHNLGSMVLDRLSLVFAAETCPGTEEYLVGRADYSSKCVYLVKPLTYVNNSGIAVSDACARFGVELEDLLVICDECELPFGKIRLRKKGQHGGHHGLESVIYHLQSEGFPRLRIGIGKPPCSDLTEYVLAEFEPEEKERLPLLLEEAERATVFFLEHGVEKAMSLVNRNDGG